MKPSSLASQILKAKYFPNCVFLKVAVGHNASFTWRSLLWGRDLFLKGVRWQVVSGESISVFQSPWIRRPLNFKPMTVNIDASRDLQVADLILKHQWNLEALHAIF